MSLSQEELNTIIDQSEDQKTKLLKTWNQAYRKGESIVDDTVYDRVLDSLNDNHPYKSKVGYEVGERKANLPIPMYSMDKIKSYDELLKWCDSKKIDKNEEVLITPKYDGLSFLIHSSSKKAWTRGNGEVGQMSDLHFKVVMHDKPFLVPDKLEGQYFIGEVIMKKSTFYEKYSHQFKNPRNLVAGLFNQKNPDKVLNDVNFMAYGLGSEEIPRVECLNLLNQFNQENVPFESIDISELNDEKLNEIFTTWSGDYEIDGLIIEITNQTLRSQLGREVNNNPAYSRAWKGFKETACETVIENIKYQISKEGKLTVVGQVTPVLLDGVTVSNVSLYNAASIKENGWGVGAKVKIIRSGMVIPKIIETIERARCELPMCCPSCSSILIWDDTNTQLICNNSENCEAQQLQKIVAFCSILEVESIGEGVAEQLYEQGYNSIPKLLSMEPTHIKKLDGFAERKANAICQNLKEKITNVPLEKIQHATGFFKGLGAKKLSLVNEFNSLDKKPSLETLIEIDGFSEISAKNYLAGFEKFWDFIKPLPITILEKKEQGSAKYSHLVIVFTGYRDKNLENKITDGDGKVTGSVSKNTTHIVTKDPNAGSSKLKKARDLNIPILTPEDFQRLL